MGNVYIYCFVIHYMKSSIFMGARYAFLYHSAAYLLNVSITFPSRTLPSVLPDEEARLGVP